MGLRDRARVPGAARLGRRVRARGGRAARPRVAAGCSSRRPTTGCARSSTRSRRRSARQRPVGHPPRPRARRPGLRPAQAVAAQRDPRPLAVGADHLRLPGARHRQRRDHRPLRHRRAEGALPAPAARGRDLLLLLDDRAARRRRPDAVQDPGGAGRRRVGHQRLEVLLVQRQDRRVPHRHGGDQPRRQRLQGHVDVPGADRHAGRRASCATSGLAGEPLGEGSPRPHPLRRRAGAGRRAARRRGPGVRHRPDPPRRRAHPPRHAHDRPGPARRST